MAYRWNGIECDTAEEVLQLQRAAKAEKTSAAVRKEHAESKDRSATGIVADNKANTDIPRCKHGHPGETCMACNKDY